MVTQLDSMKLLEDAAEEQMRRLLSDVPLLQVDGVEHEAKISADLRPDFVVKVTAHRRAYTLICELKAHAQPRSVRDAATQLKYYAGKIGRSAYGVLFAP
jgi:hypothetical protein